MRKNDSGRQAPSLDLSDLLNLQVTEGALDARNMKIAIVATQWYDTILDQLLAGAVRTLRECGMLDGNLTVVRVPGAFELPLALDQLAETRRYHALIALGCVIRGGTPHFEFVCTECARGVQEVSLKRGLPVAFGVLTCDSMAQAEERAEPGENNKGREAALAAVRMVSLLGKLRRG